MILGFFGSTSMRLLSWEMCWSRVLELGRCSTPQPALNRASRLSTFPLFKKNSLRSRTSLRLSSIGKPSRYARSSDGSTLRSSTTNESELLSFRTETKYRRVTARIRATTSFTPNGFTIKSSAPSSKPKTLSISSDFALMKRTGIFSSTRQISRQTS